MPEKLTFPPPLPPTYPAAFPPLQPEQLTSFAPPEYVAFSPSYEFSAGGFPQAATPVAERFGTQETKFFMVTLVPLMVKGSQT
jgi:hypothetical protein